MRLKLRFIALVAAAFLAPFASAQGENKGPPAAYVGPPTVSSIDFPMVARRAGLQGKVKYTIKDGELHLVSGRPILADACGESLLGSAVAWEQIGITKFECVYQLVGDKKEVDTVKRDVHYPTLAKVLTLGRLHDGTKTVKVTVYVTPRYVPCVFERGDHKLQVIVGATRPLMSTDSSRKKS